MIDYDKIVSRCGYSGKVTTKIVFFRVDKFGNKKTFKSVFIFDDI